jgi:GntR family transcriptional repressor for pyruvate dehydrogenase complex
MRFQKLKQIRVSNLLAGQIEEAIELGKLKPGDRLPSERELIKQLGVSRRTISEGLRILEQKGLIEIKVGVKGGAFVNELTTDQISKGLDLLIRFKKLSVLELSEFRKDAEGIIASRAALLATIEEIDYLKSLIAEADELFKLNNNDEFDWKAFMDIDKRMHMTLAKASRNLITQR